MSANAGFLFYKDYYDDEQFDWHYLNKGEGGPIPWQYENNKAILKAKSDYIVKKLTFEKYPIEFPNKFPLTTTYPGLILGTGYHHETGVEEEFKIGCYFDYTTGLPVIPGSSVKGVIRSAFPGQSKQYKTEKTIYIRNILSGIDTQYEGIDINALEKEIFEGIQANPSKEANKTYLPIYQRDIFHDAFPVEVGKDGLYSDDFLTPHGTNPLKNPIPLKFLKISPKVTFQFNFKLNDGLITKDDKIKLFQNILLDFGIGAKTNVGYGQFDRSEFEKLLQAEQEQQEKEKQEAAQKQKALKLAAMSEIDKAIFQIKDKGMIEKDVNELYYKIDAFNADDQRKAAVFIKDFFVSQNKWNVKKKKQKQYAKVCKLKSILGEV